MTDSNMGACRSLLVIALLVASGCGDSVPNPASPDRGSPDAASAKAPLIQAAKPTAPSLVADVALHAGFGYLSAPLVSTCPGAVSSNYTVQFGHSQCLVVQPTGASYALTDDIALNTIQKRGVITHIQFRAQDVIGSDGIRHETDPLPIDPPVAPNAAGFTLHVHQDHVPVWWLSGHINGSRVEIIGTISIWDVVYRAP